jgi:hypothetical protein
MLSYLRHDRSNFLIPMAQYDSRQPNLLSRNGFLAPKAQTELFEPAISTVTLIHNSKHPYELKENIVNLAY